MKSIILLALLGIQPKLLLRFCGAVLSAEFDAYTTRQMDNKGGKEYDPLARPFVHNSSLYFTVLIPTFVAFGLQHSSNTKVRAIGLWSERALIVGHTGAAISNEIQLNNYTKMCAVQTALYSLQWHYVPCKEVK